MSSVIHTPPAPSEVMVAHVLQRLALETDCAEVAEAMRENQQDFVVLHVVGAPETYAKRHIPGAIHIRHRFITPERMAEWPHDTLFVVYCAGPHCNGADQAALKLARLGRPVKIMIGGVTGWRDEGLPFAHGSEPGEWPRG